MYNSIPNPTKKIVLDFSIADVKKAIARVTVISYPKYRLDSVNDVINTLTLECFEFLSLGVYIDFSLTNVGDTKTEVNMEIRRKIGSFDNSVEIQNASQHFVTLLNMISQSITLTDEQFTQTYSAVLAKIEADKVTAAIPWFAKKYVASAYIFLGVCTLPFLIGLVILPLGIYAKVKQVKYNRSLSTAA